jgi:hypothetical protein
MSKTIYLSNNTQYDAQLVVYRDWIESNGKWRLFWDNPNDPGCGVHDESTVTGQPFFRTKREAVRHGERKYNQVAISQTW